MKPNVIKRVIDWNKKRGLDQKPFDLVQEVAYVYSEVLELVGQNSPDHDQIAYDYIKQIRNQDVILDKSVIADGFGDIIVFSLGAIYKLGYDPQEILNLIMDANDKKGTQFNHLGKIVKSSDFVAPDLSKATNNKKID